MENSSRSRNLRTYASLNALRLVTSPSSLVDLEAGSGTASDRAGEDEKEEQQPPNVTITFGSSRSTGSNGAARTRFQRFRCTSSTSSFLMQLCRDSPSDKIVRLSRRHAAPARARCLNAGLDASLKTTLLLGVGYLILASTIIAVVVFTTLEFRIVPSIAWCTQAIRMLF